ncbi:MAG TPA: Hsp20/alpha crystallin family protein [Acidimicrobiia bacterium]|jgi:HSP20 family protein|nr:Hsp20/alpha crystallin family protein [Acidimicrobiia bacterium]
MTVAGFDPFSTFERMLGRTGWAETGGGRALALPVDVYRSGDDFIIEVDVPGMDPSSLDLTVERNMLSIAGERPARHDADVLLCERPHARFTRQLYLAENLDTDQVAANYEHGVLTITIPLSAKARGRQIEIKSGEEPAIDVGDDPGS